MEKELLSGKWSNGHSGDHKLDLRLSGIKTFYPAEFLILSILQKER
jgi:hypothetical protein